MDDMVAGVISRVGGSEATVDERKDIIYELREVDRELFRLRDQNNRFASLQTAFDKLAKDYEALRQGNLKRYRIFPTVGNTFPNKLLLIKTLREVQDMGLVEAKKCIDEGNVILPPEKRELFHKILMDRPELNASVSVGEPKSDDIPF